MRQLRKRRFGSILFNEKSNLIIHSALYQPCYIANWVFYGGLGTPSHAFSTPLGSPFMAVCAGEAVVRDRSHRQPDRVTG